MYVSAADDPQATLLKVIAKKKAISKMLCPLLTNSARADGSNYASLHQAPSKAHTYTIQPELISQLARPLYLELGQQH